MKKTELLIPVGNQECLIAAIHNGADAVYLGGKKFGARAYSNNFNEEEMVKAIKLCHLYGVKIYVTVNTMIYNEEIKEVLNYLNFLYSNNVDAVIMQDNGLIELTRKLIPNLEIHVSTQAHNHNSPAIQHYKEIGCTRVVFDRESSLESIANINVDEYGLEMLKAGTNLDKYTEAELINLDAKKVEKEDIKYVIAQVNTVSIEDVLKRQEKLEEVINKEIQVTNFLIIYL